MVLLLCRFEAEEDCFMFVNAGGDAFSEEAGGITFLADTYFDGGNVMRTNEQIVEGGDYPLCFLYGFA